MSKADTNTTHTTPETIQFRLVNAGDISNIPLRTDRPGTQKARQVQATARPFGCWTQHPVGALEVPSQTIHIPEELYQYVLQTKDDEDDQSTSGRATELMQKGRVMEAKHE